MKQMLSPFAKISKTSFLILALGQIICALLLWQYASSGLIPQPTKIASAFVHLLQQRFFWDNILVSLILTIKAMCIAILITLFFAYVSVIPFFATVARFLVKCRYLTLTGLIFIFTLLTKDGGQLKMSLLIFGIVPFFTTSFLSVIICIDKQQYELCKTLRYSNWETLYEVIIVGKADQVIEIIRQNFAIAWMMITMVEGLSMSEGGLGTLFIKYNKVNDLTNILALQVTLFSIGLLFDYLLGSLKYWLFPYSKLQIQEA